jgi:hypothetical protein
LRGRVRFLRHNLVRDSIPPAGEGAFDLIVCRNVFIYFLPEAVTATIDALQRCLRPHGVLILGAADRLASPTRPKGAVDRRVGPRRAAGGQERRRSATGSREPSPKPLPMAERRVESGGSAPRSMTAGLNAPPDEAAARTTALRSALHAADTGRLNTAISAADELLARTRSMRSPTTSVASPSCPPETAPGRSPICGERFPGCLRARTRAGAHARGAGPARHRRPPHARAHRRDPPGAGAARRRGRPVRLTSSGSLRLPMFDMMLRRRLHRGGRGRVRSTPFLSL